MDAKKNKKLQTDKSVEKIIDDMTLFDDDLMSMVFDENIPAAELLLIIILKRDDIEVISVVGQKELESPVVGGRNIRLDILVKDGHGEFFNVEVQRSNAGADERRARFHSSMIDSRMLKEGQEFKELLESYVIMITQNDYFGYGLPIYTINRHLEELGTIFQDGSHILYVNGSYKGEDPLGRLMHDFGCKNAKDMFYAELASGVKHFKEEGGRELMCQAVEEYAKKKAQEAAMKAAQKAAIEADIKAGIAYGIDKMRIIERAYEEYGISKKEAEEIYDAYAVLAI